MCHSGARGFTLIDMIGTMAMFGVVVAIAFPHVDLRRMDTDRFLQSLVGDIRLARLRAITSGVHYAVRVNEDGEGATGYQVVEMEDAGAGMWADSTRGWKREVAIPPTVAVASEDGPFELEFNTRGMLVSSNRPVALMIFDDFGAERGFTVWPSGQVYVE